MAAEPYVAQGGFFSKIEEAVGTGFAESGLAGIAEREGGKTLAGGLNGYVDVMLAAFTHRGAMFERYQTERGKFAALADETYFDAILKRIQDGDVALFHGLFLSGIYVMEEAARACAAFGDVAVLLRGDRKEHSFFGFLQAHSPEVMEGIGVAAEHLNIPRPKKMFLYTPAIEKALGRN